MRVGKTLSNSGEEGRRVWGRNTHGNYGEEKRGVSGWIHVNAYFNVVDRFEEADKLIVYGVIGTEGRIATRSVYRDQRRKQFGQRNKLKKIKKIKNAWNKGNEPK